MVENQQYVIGEEMISESVFTLVGYSWLNWIGCFLEILSKTGKIYTLLLEIELKNRIEKACLEFEMLKKNNTEKESKHRDFFFNNWAETMNTKAEEKVNMLKSNWDCS